MFSIVKEEYRPIKDFPLYEVSNYGNIRSWNNTRSNKRECSKQLKPCLRWAKGARYLCVTLCKKGKQKNVKVHRLVLETFVGPCPEGMEGCHNNGIATDNRLENLRWDTHLGNCKDQIKHGTTNKGKIIGTYKLKECEVLEIRRLSKLKVKPKLIAAMFKIAISNVWYIVNNKTWAHL